MPHNQTVIDAIMSNDAESLRKILRTLRSNKEDINALDENRNSYLHIAAKKLLNRGAPSNFYILELLLEYGVVPELQNKEGKKALEMGDVNILDNENHMTPLHTSINRSFSNLFNLLIKSKAVDLDKPSQDGLSPISAAAFNPPSPEKLLALIEAGANLFIGYGKKPDQFNPLKVAFGEYDDNLRDKEFYGKLINCINILIDCYAGIGFSFYPYKEATTKYDFTDKIVLGSKIDERYKKLNPTIVKSISTIDALDERIEKKGLNKEDEYEKIKKACIKILNACNNIDQEMYERVNNVLEALNKRPFSSKLSPPLNPPHVEDKDDDRNSKAKEKSSVVSSVVAFFKGSNPSKPSTKDPSPATKTTGNSPSRLP